MVKKNVICGLGEIGTPILKLISKSTPAVGYDINPKLINQKQFKKYQLLQTSFLHICIPSITSNIFFTHLYSIHWEIYFKYNFTL